MSTLVFKSPEGAPHDTEISGVGVLQAGGSNSIPVETAAQFLVELQHRDEDGALIDPDISGRGQPLGGKKLEEAAKEFAAARGLEVVSLADKKLDKEGAENAAPLDDLPSPVEVGRAAYVQTFGDQAPPLAGAVIEAEPDAADDEGGKS